MRLFSAPSSFVIEDRRGILLSARIAADGQWRFPARNRVPPKFAGAVITCEDRRFKLHPGFDPVALIRALVLDIRTRSLVSGGSTITMQVVRLSRSNPPRTIVEKMSEMLASVKLTMRRSKDAVLSLYASHAPFGGNVVGLDAAAWRYFGRPPQDLSWAESATLAVLPNEPGLVHPGRNRARLLQKRNRLLGALRARGIIDSMEFKLAIAEPLVSEVRPLPDHCPQLLDRIAAESGKRNEGARITTTIDYNLQRRVTELVMRRHRTLASNQIHNAAAVVLDVPTGEALAYVSIHAPAWGATFGCGKINKMK